MLMAVKCGTVLCCAFWSGLFAGGVAMACDAATGGGLLSLALSFLCFFLFFLTLFSVAGEG